MGGSGKTSDELGLRVRVALGRLRCRIGDRQTGCQESNRYGELGGLRLVGIGVDAWLRNGYVGTDSRQA